MLLERDQDRVDIIPKDFWSFNVQIENFDKTAMKLFIQVPTFSE